MALMFHDGFNPLLGMRIGEAANPGPPAAELQARRARARHLLAQMGRLPAGGMPDWEDDQEEFEDANSAGSQQTRTATVTCDPDVDSIPDTASENEWPRSGTTDIEMLELGMQELVSQAPAEPADPRLQQPGVATAENSIQEQTGTPGIPPPPATLPPILPPAAPLPAPPLRAAGSRFVLPVPASGLAAAAARTAVSVARRLRSTPLEGSLPPRAQQVLDRQRWSTFFCPLLWAAAGDDITHTVLQWLTEALRGAPFEASVGDRCFQGSAAARAGWLALRAAMRSVGIDSKAAFAAWMEQQGSPFMSVAIDSYLSKDAQEHMIPLMSFQDGGVSALEAALSAVALHIGRHLEDLPAQLPRVPRLPPAPSARSRARPARRPEDTQCPYPVQEAERLSNDENLACTAENRQHQRTRDSDDPLGQCWEQLESIDLPAEVRLSVATLQNVPRALRGRMRHAWGIALRRLRTLHEMQVPSEEAKVRAWTLFLLLPRMLLHRPRAVNYLPWEDLCRRFERFERGEWLSLIEEARGSSRGAGGRSRAPGPNPVSTRLEQAQRKVQLGEPSHARRVLTAQALAPGTPATLRTLQERRPTQGAELPEAVQEPDPQVHLNFETKRFLENLRSASKGVSGGPAGGRNEHYQVCLDDERVAPGKGGILPCTCCSARGGNSSSKTGTSHGAAEGGWQHPRYSHW